MHLPYTHLPSTIELPVPPVEMYSRIDERILKQDKRKRRKPLILNTYVVSTFQPP
jgi:hypothetical protein